VIPIPAAAWPTCAPQQPGETMPEYAARCLAFILRENSTGRLSDDQLRHADQAAQLAAASLPARLDGAGHVYDRILSDVRHRIAQATAQRAQERRSVLAQPSTPPPTPGEQGGQAARLQPPVPRLPPSPAYAIPGPARAEIRF
jgi:hypothetical protein